MSDLPSLDRWGASVTFITWETPEYFRGTTFISLSFCGWNVWLADNGERLSVVSQDDTPEHLLWPATVKTCLASGQCHWPHLVEGGWPNWQNREALRIFLLLRLTSASLDICSCLWQEQPNFACGLWEWEQVLIPKDFPKVSQARPASRPYSLQCSVGPINLLRHCWDGTGDVQGTTVIPSWGREICSHVDQIGSMKVRQKHPPIGTRAVIGLWDYWLP